MLKVWIDGSCIPKNPGGTAAYGLIVKNNTDKELLKSSCVIGTGDSMSNNVAEYNALLAFLIWYKENKLSEDVTIYSDSQLVVNQMSGKWKVNGGLYHRAFIQCRAEQAKTSLRLEHNPFTYCWIPREQNTEADELSKSVQKI